MLASFDFDQAEGLRRMLAGPKPRIVTFLSATPQDDKGAMLINLGASLAQPVEDEEDRRRRHVAERAEYLARDRVALLGDADRPGAGLEDAGPAGVQRPGPHLVHGEAVRGEPPVEPAAQLALDHARHAGGERHLEPMVADAPGHELRRILEERGAVRGDRPAVVAAAGLRAAHHRSRAVREDRVGHEPVRVPAVLVVQRAEFHRADEDAGVGIAGRDPVGHAQAVERAVAPHEPHVRALHRAAEAEVADEPHVEVRRGEPRARDRDDVRHVGWIDAGAVERSAGGARGEARRVLLVARHALPRGGAAVARVLHGREEGLRRQSVAAVGVEHRAVARLHVRQAIQRLELPALVLALAAILGGEGHRMFLRERMGRRGRAHAVDPEGHRVIPRGAPALPRATRETMGRASDGQCESAATAAPTSDGCRSARATVRHERWLCVTVAS